MGKVGQIGIKRKSKVGNESKENEESVAKLNMIKTIVPLPFRPLGCGAKRKLTGERKGNGRKSFRGNDLSASEQLAWRSDESESLIIVICLVIK